MFYEPKDGHGLPHNPIQGCVVPRPIGWISTRSAAGVDNLSPYSHFNLAGMLPPMLMFCSNGPHVDGPMKDSATNAIETGEFVHNVATYALREKMIASSAHFERGVDEFERVGLTKLPSRLVGASRVAESPVAFECRVIEIVNLPCTMANSSNIMVIGEIVGVHIEEYILRDGLIDIGSLDPIARLGYNEYSKVSDVFAEKRPDDLLAKY
ncbi:flavin reductase family protein [Sphingobium sp. MK2]|uniref:flavin reductase family protein n=1 Tax=Sphingobium sp. MK2 TaxID=3116540 RepID=UPI0032E365C2